MPVEADCPACGAVFNLKEDYVGKKVRCKKCEHVFTVGGEKLNEAGDVGAVPAGAADGAPGGSATDDDDDRGVPSAVAEVGQDTGEEGSAGPEGRAGSKRPKRFRPDEEDGDAVPRDGRKVATIMVAVVTALLLVCGGGIYGIVRVVKSASKELDDLEAARKAAQPTSGDVGGLLDFERQPKDLAEALSYLKSKTAGDRRGAANWLAKQTVNDARRKDVAQALEPLLKEEDTACAAAARALKVWGTPENGPALTAALKSKPDNGIVGDAPKELMAAVGHVKHESGAHEVARFLPNVSAGEDAYRALADLGPGAGKVVLKYLDHPNEGARDRARRLLRDYKTQPAAYLDQATEDLGAVDPERAQAAAEWLANATSDDALALAKREPERRTAVGVALNRLVESPPTSSEEIVLGAVKRWGTKDNVPALIAMFTTKPYKRQVADALIAIGPACEPEVKKLLGHRDPVIVDESKRILTGIGSPDAKFVAAIEDLKSNDVGRIGQGARALQALPVDEKQRADVVAALQETIKDTGVGRGDPLLEDVAKALAVWTGKEDGLQIVEKVKQMHPFFCKKSRKVLIEWMGKRKVEQAIPFLVGALADEDTGGDAGRALEAMGPALGEKIEVEVLKAIEPLKMQENDRIYLLDCIKVLGAVGTKKISLPRLKSQQGSALKMKDEVVAKACADAIAAINSR